MSEAVGSLLAQGAGPRADLNTMALKSAAAGDGKRVAKAALDFEGLLLTNWLQAIEESDRALGGNDESAGSETMGALGTQALAHAIAARGGIGLATMLLAHLPAASAAPAAPATPTLSGAESAGANRSGSP